MSNQATPRRTGRNATGGGLLTLMMAVTAFIILVSLGVFSIEGMRAYTVRDELKAATSAAALAGAAALASSDSTDPTTAHLNATIAAFDTFNKNSVANFKLGMASTATNDSNIPGVGLSSLYVEFRDPVTNAVVPASDSRGTTVRCVGAFDLPPMLSVIGFAFPVRAESIGQTPQLDMVVCLDLSNSIDDMTKVTFVRRRWDPTATSQLGGRGAIAYDVVAAPAGSYQQNNVSPRAAGRLLDILMPDPQGCSVNATPPQLLDSSDAPNQAHTPLTFTSAGMSLRGTSGDMGTPPGNYPSGAMTWPSTEYSDLVTNLDKNNDFAGGTFNGYSFPNLATLVEASRGNLENNAVFVSSKANTSVPSSVTPRAGYQAAYLSAANAALEPFGSAKRGAMHLIQIMNNNTNAHFGFVGFNQSAHTTPTDVQTDASIGGSYPQGGLTTAHVGGLSLSSSQNNFQQITGPNGVLTVINRDGGTAIGDAIQAATDMLAGSQSRTNAKRAIVLLTDGMNMSGMNAYTAAANCKNANKGIALYTVGVAQVSDIVPYETDLLNEGGAGTSYSYVDPRTGALSSYTATRDGVCKTVGNGSKFFLVTRLQDLDYVFENIARQLVSISE